MSKIDITKLISPQAAFDVMQENASPAEREKSDRRAEFLIELERDHGPRFQALFAAMYSLRAITQYCVLTKPPLHVAQALHGHSQNLLSVIVAALGFTNASDETLEAVIRLLDEFCEL